MFFHSNRKLEEFHLHNQNYNHIPFEKSLIGIEKCYPRKEKSQLHPIKRVRVRNQEFLFDGWQLKLILMGAYASCESISKSCPLTHSMDLIDRKQYEINEYGVCLKNSSFFSRKMWQMAAQAGILYLRTVLSLHPSLHIHIYLWSPFVWIHSE